MISGNEDLFHAATGFTPGKADMELSRASNFAFVIVESGKATCEINLSRFNLTKGGVLIIGSNIFYQITYADSDFRISYISFSVKIWEVITARINPAFFSYLSKHQYVTTGKKDSGSLARIHAMISAARDICEERGHSFRHEMLRNIAQNVLFEIYEIIKPRIMDSPGLSHGRKEELFTEFIRLVKENSTEHREVSFYADKLCITTRYLSSVVKEMTGISPKELIDRRCIQEIKMALRTSTDTIQEIAFMLHFHDQSYLARYFRRHAGQSPAEYRNDQPE